MEQKIKNLTKIILIALLFAIPASCCEIYILYEDDDYTVLLDNVTNVGVCDMYLMCDSDLVNVTNVVGGDFDHFDYNYVNDEDVDDHTTLYTQAIQVNNPGLDGNVDYAEIELWINDNEKGMINISVKEIREETMDGDSIPYTVHNFSVSIPPSATVGSPDGGERWKAGTSQNIEWTATDNVGVTSIDIEYSTDGGATYQTIATNTLNDGTYLWKIPDTPSGACKVLVIARDAAGNTGEDVSDGDFIIASATSALPDGSDDGSGGSSSSGGGLYLPMPAQSPSPTPSAPPAAPSAATSDREETPASTTTPAPEKVTTFRTEPLSPSPPALSPIAGIVLVVIAAILGVARVIGITSQTSDETYAEAIVSIKQAECRKAIAAIVGIVVVAVVAISGILLV